MTTIIHLPSLSKHTNTNTNTYTHTNTLYLSCFAVLSIIFVKIINVTPSTAV